MSDRLNTTFGWLLFAGVVALLLRFFVDLAMPEAERPEQMGYVIEGVESGEGGAEGPALATLLATGDVAAGEAVFAKCTACHTIEQGGANGIGPNLWEVVGEPIGEGRGFDWSSALSEHGGEWTYENLDAWLKSPRAFANGTKMSFAGLSDPQDRANVILYLRANGGGPDLPAPPAEEPAADEAAVDGEAEVTTEGGEAIAADGVALDQTSAVGNAGQE